MGKWDLLYHEYTKHDRCWHMARESRKGAEEM